MKYTLKIKNVGRGEEFFKVWDNKGTKRIVEFNTKKAAEEAALIVEKLREDSAFQYVRISPIS